MAFKVEFTECLFEENNSSQFSVINLYSKDTSDCESKFIKCQFIKNDGNLHGAIYNEYISLIKFQECQFYKNTAKMVGGSIYFHHSK